jgi:intein/homing endonuclease
VAEKKKTGLAALVRKSGLAVKTAQAQLTVDSSSGPPIFNILEYVEAPWGLDMKLFPAQRFIVKLYYNLPLDDTLPEDPNKQIQIFDMFGEHLLHTFTEKEYLRYLYNEGRCNIGEQDHNRRELILALGRRAGKCVDANTLIPTPKGVFRIEELGVSAVDQFSTAQIGIVQEAGRRAEANAFYNGGIKPTFTLRTKSGYSITGTGNHRIKVLGSSGQVEWRYLGDVQPGLDFAALNRNTDLWATEYLDVRNHHNTDGRKKVSLPTTLDETLGNFMGYLVGDGHWNDGHSTPMTVEHPETWEYATKLFQQLFGKSRVSMDKRTKNTGKLEYCSVKVRRFLDSLGWKLGTARDQKMVPWSILRSPKTVVCAFLRGLFETDGCAEKGGKCLTFSSASFRLAHEVQTLLLNLGIVSSVTRKWVKKTQKFYANLLIKGLRSRRLFADLIGFDSDKKRIPMLASLETDQEGKSSTESIPHQMGLLREWLKTIPRGKCSGWRRSVLRDVLGNSCKPRSGERLTYSRLVRAVPLAKELLACVEETAHFEELLRLDYFYDEVVSVEQGESQVYDLTVPDGESFVGNGWTNHNTALSGIFASYEIYRLLNLYNPQAYYGLPNGNRIQIISVATDKDQAGLLYNEVTSHLAKCQYFDPYISNNTLGWVNFRTPYDIEKFGPNVRQEDGRFVSLNGKATLRVTFKSCIAKGLRGSGNVVIVLDEIAHFLDKGGSSAGEIYDSVTPSAAAFSRKDPKTGRPAIDPKTGKKAEVESRIILISSPLGKSGKFYEKFDLAMGGGEGAENLLAIQAPTWEINPTIPASYYKEHYHADPVSFMTEHGAQFSDQVCGWITRESDLIACVEPNKRPLVVARPRMPHQMGIDVGLVSDGTAIAITHVDGEKVVHDYHEVWQAKRDWRETNPHLSEPSTEYAKTLHLVERLDFDEIADWIAVLCKRFSITKGLFDRWNGIPLEQALHKKGLKQFTSEFFTRDNTSKMYQSVWSFLYDERLVLYDYPIPERAAEGGMKHSPFIAELLSLQANHVSKNIVIVEAPKKKGAHDDLSDAFVRSVWLSIEALMDQKHVARGGRDNSPYVTPIMTAQSYQKARARQHGGFGDRMTPKNLGRSLLGRSLYRGRP